MSQEPSSAPPNREEAPKPRPRKQPKSPSRRRPHIGWHSNAADRIEREMHATGYDIWGYVIYRTTYSSQSDWEEFLRRLRCSMKKSFDRCCGRDILDKFVLTVFDDAARFDGADTRAIRKHFRQWSAGAAVTERLSLEERQKLPKPRASPFSDAPWGAGRYNLCVMVDEDSLRSVVDDIYTPLAMGGTREGWVKLINKHWIPIEEDPRRRPGWERVCTYDPIDEITERDVGWQKIWCPEVMASFYYEAEGLNRWRGDYRRPPDVNS